MTDVPVTTTLPASPAAAPNTPTKSPLDILEEILNDPKSKTPIEPGTAAASVTSAVPEAATQPPPAVPQLTAEEIAAQQQVQDQADQQALAAETAELKTIVNTPAYQARVQQAAAAQEETQQHVEATKEFEIKQLEHSKIPVPVNAPVSEANPI